jgi:AraC-like DNA-binding protein
MLQPPRRSRFSTDDLPSRERVDIYREQLFDRHMHMDFIDRSPNGFRFDGEVLDFGPARVGRVRGTRSSYLRSRQNLADGRDVVSILIHTEGRFHIEGGREAADPSRAGAAVMGSRHEFGFHFLDDGGSCLGLCLERKLLEPLLAGVEEPLLRCLPRRDPALRLLTGYLETLFAIEQDCDPVLVAMHLGDLALSTLGVTGDVRALARERGVSAARQRAVLDRIAHHAGEPDLDPARVAQRLGMSVRYLHRLLEPTGRSFSEHLVAQRLERAAAMLRDPSFTHVKISDVAGKAGFSDISHFNRSFRHAFGDTPFGLRVRAARRAGAS